LSAAVAARIASKPQTIRDESSAATILITNSPSANAQHRREPASHTNSAQLRSRLISSGLTAFTHRR
jgi:hypothetical protein